MFRTGFFCTALAFALASLALSGCAASKSANPLSPSVAGPIPGVAITAPGIVQPTSGSIIAVDQQPVTLMIQNSTSNGSRPLTYLVEVATDAQYVNKVFVKDAIAPGDGRTSVRLPDPLATGKVYYWRARAQDGANTSEYSASVTFNIVTPVVIGAPIPTSPINDARTSDLSPTFTFNNAPRSGPAGAITYTLDLATDANFVHMVAVWTVTEQPNTTSLPAPQNFAYDAQYFWRVRAHDTTPIVGPDSAVQVFRTPEPPPPPPPPVVPTGPTGPTGDGSWPPGPGVNPPKPPNIVTTDVEEVRKRVRWGLWSVQSSDDESYWMNAIVLHPEPGHTPGWVSDDYWYDKIARGDGRGRGYVWPPR